MADIRSFSSGIAEAARAQVAASARDLSALRL
jgi:hypothetical protein